MPDLAQLTIVVNSQDAVTTASRLQQLLGVSVQVENQANRLTTAARAQGAQFQALTGFAGQLIGAFTALATVREGVDQAFASDRLEKGFANILHDAEAGRAVLQQLKDYSENSQFTFPGIADSARQLMSLGMSADQAVRTIKAVGDQLEAIGSDQTNIQSIVTQLQRMLETGQANMYVFRSLAAQGIPAVQYLAQALGVDMQRAYQLLRTGAVSGQDAVKVLTYAMEANARGAVDTRKTYTQLWQELKNNVAIALGKVTEEFLKQADAATFLQALINGVRYLGQNTQVLLPILKDIAAVLTIIVAYELASWLLSAASAATMLLAPLGAVYSLLRLLGGAKLANLSSELTGVKQALTGVWVAAKSVLVIFAALAAIEYVRYLGSEFAIVRRMLVEVGAQANIVWESIKLGASIAGAGVRLAWEAALGAIKTVYAGFLVVFATGWKDGLLNAETLLQALEYAGKVTFYSLQFVWEAVISAMKTAFAGFLALVAKGFGNISTGLGVAAAAAFGAGNPALGQGALAAATKATAVQSSINDTAAGIKTGDPFGDFNKRVDEAKAHWDLAMGDMAASADKIYKPLMDTAAGIKTGDPFGDFNRSVSRAKENYADAVENINANAKRFEDGITESFGGAERKGQTFQQFLSNDLKSAMDQVGPILKAGSDELDKFLVFTESHFGSWAKSLGSTIQSVLNRVNAFTGSALSMTTAGAFIQRMMDQAKQQAAGVGTPENPPGEGPPAPPKIQPQFTEQFQEQMDKTLGKVEQEANLVSLTTLERQKQLQVYQLLEQLEAHGVADTDKAYQILVKYNQELTKLQALQQIHELAQGLAQDFANAFGEFITGAKNAKQAVMDLAKAIEQTLVKQLVEKPITEGLTSLLSGLGGAAYNAFSGQGQPLPSNLQSVLGADVPVAAKGAVFQDHTAQFANIMVKPYALGGVLSSMPMNVNTPSTFGIPSSQVMAYANGGVFGEIVRFEMGGGLDRGSIYDSPTLFPMAGGRTGMLGEAGPEAIIPLSRGADGKLGVAGGHSETNNSEKHYHFNMNISTPDADSFRRSRRQMAGIMQQLTRD